MLDALGDAYNYLADAGDKISSVAKKVLDPNLSELLHSKAEKFNNGVAENLRFPPSVLGTEEMPHIIAFHIKDKINVEGGGFATDDKGNPVGSDAMEAAAYQADYAGLKGELGDILMQAGGVGLLGRAAGYVTGKVISGKKGESAQKSINAATDVLVGGLAVKNIKDLADTRGYANQKAGRMFRFKAPSVRTKYSVFLPMPTKVESDYLLSYNEQSTQNAASGILRGAVSLDFATGSARGITTIGESLFESISAKFGGSELLNAYLGRAANPLNELLFKSVERRDFTFKFTLRPQSQKEAQAIYDIVKRFKMAAMPEFDYSKKSCYWINPNEFDIEFLRSDGKGNIENAYLHKIGTCACTKFNVSYGNNTGPWTVYDGYGGKYWAPILTEITLSFTELDLLNKQRIQEGR